MVTPFKNRFLLLCAIVAMASTCSAETRWCSVTVKAKSDTIFYPPIARAAHIEGTIVSRMTFSPSGKVIGLETVFGPPLLSTSANNQMKSWTVQTDAKGEELCQGLIIINFVIGETEAVEEIADAPPTIFHINVQTHALVLNAMSDPSPIIGKSHWSWLKRLRAIRASD